VRLRVVVLYSVKGCKAYICTFGKLLLCKECPLSFPLNLNAYLHHLRLSGLCRYFTTNGKQTVYRIQKNGIMSMSDRGMAPQVVTHPGAWPTERMQTVDTRESSAPYAHPSIEDHYDTLEAHYACLERLHACYEGVLYIGHLVEAPGTGEETEVIEAVPCHRCTDSR
jgi:hypothetical protein